MALPRYLVPRLSLFSASASSKRFSEVGPTRRINAGTRRYTRVVKRRKHSLYERSMISVFSGGLYSQRTCADQQTFNQRRYWVPLGPKVPPAYELPCTISHLADECAVLRQVFVGVGIVPSSLVHTVETNHRHQSRVQRGTLPGI